MLNAVQFYLDIYKEINTNQNSIFTGVKEKTALNLISKMERDTNFKFIEYSTNTLRASFLFAVKCSKQRSPFKM